MTNSEEATDRTGSASDSTTAFTKPSQSNCGQRGDAHSRGKAGVKDEPETHRPGRGSVGDVVLPGGQSQGRLVKLLGDKEHRRTRTLLLCWFLISVRVFRRLHSSADHRYSPPSPSPTTGHRNSGRRSVFSMGLVSIFSSIAIDLDLPSGSIKAHLVPLETIIVSLCVLSTHTAFVGTCLETWRVGTGVDAEGGGVFGDRVVLQPTAAGETIEVLAGVNGLVYFTQNRPRYNQNAVGSAESVDDDTPSHGNDTTSSSLSSC
ncbi:hypothetical protein EYF80_028393 [Liparis tanakae]|uniref:Uncharacterized protein n=1 Tax=Liparis tanakae TaxID=230148 RepID=A0A4Z2H6L6_9TELE|nr:hypothetical protein EYF80_028393 [Liparis tanakae]